MVFLKKLLFQLDLIFHFYRKLILSSLGLSIILGFLSYPIEAVIALKILLIGAVFLYFQFIEADDKLLFYKNFRLTPFLMFWCCIFFDSILSILIFKIFNLTL